MGAADVSLVRAVWDALERGDVAGALAPMAPDIRWHGAEMADAPSACHGREHVRRLLTDLHAAGRRGRLLDLRDAGHAVVTTVVTASADHRETHGELVTVRDGRVDSIVVYPTVAEALRAAGLRPSRRPSLPLAGQLGDPSGPAGRLVTTVLNVANRGLNRAAVDALSPLPDERVLDVGVGGGIGTGLVLARRAQVVAIDPSADVVASARRRLGGRADVRRGSAAAPGVAGMDAALAVNSIYFWPTVEHGLAGVRGALGDGGRVAIGVEHGPLRRRARDHVDLPGTPAELARRLAVSGFDAVQTLPAGRGRSVLLATKAATVLAP